MENKLTPGQILAINITTKILDAFSIVPCAILAFLYIKIQNLRTFAMSIIFQLCICCIIAHLVIMIIQTSWLQSNDDQQTFICELQGVLLTTFDSLLLVWTTALAIIACLSFTHSHFIENNETKCKIAIIISCWVYPLIWGILSYFFGSPMFVDGYICVITSKIMTMIESIVNILIFVINIFFITKLIISIRKTLNNHETEIGNLQNIYYAYFWRLIKYLIVQLIIFGPITVLRLLYCITKDQTFLAPNSFWWTFIRECIFSSAGLIYAIVYGFNEQLVDEGKKLICCESQPREQEFFGISIQCKSSESLEEERSESTSEVTYPEVIL